MPDVINIVAGFGGSGGKILAEYAGLLASDLRWSRDASRQVYFLLCDTDVEELGQAEKRINGAFGGSAVMRPHLEIVKLGVGVGVIEPAIRGKWNRLDATEQARLSEKWWTRGEEVFTARHLPMDPTRGAGQCPMVSYFCAINKAGELRRGVESLCDKIDDTGHGGKRPQVDLNIVSSLAGGTGRGCWSTLAFLLRRELTKRFGEVKPTGFFLDQGVFESVQRDKVRQRFRMRVNSLTGLSEVVMWSRLARMDRESADQPPYFLPNLADPGDPMRDIVQVHDSMDPVQTNSPIDYAQIVFEKSKAGGLSNPSKYYTMVASGLYARLTESSIGTEEQNDLPPLGAFGSARTEVPFASISAYLRSAAGSVLCDRLANNHGSSGKVSIGSVLGSLDPRLATGRGDDEGDSDRVWIGKKIRNVVAKAASKEARLTDFRQHLADQSEEDARETLSQVVRGGGSDVVEAALQAVLQEFTKDGASLDSGWLARRMGAASSQVMASGAEALPETVLISNELAAELRSAKEAMKQLVARSGGESAPNEKQLRKLFEDATGYEYFSLKPWQKFSETEQEDLASKATALWRMQTTKAVVTRLVAEIDAAIARAEQVDGRGQQLCEWARKVRSTEYKAAEDEDQLGNVFLVRRRDGLGWDVQRATSGAHHRDRFVSRVLLPRYDRQQIQELVDQALDEGYAAERARELQKFIAEHILPVRASAGLEDDDAESDDETLRKRFKALVQSVVDSVSFSPRSMIETFAFDKVVESHRVAWSEEMKRATGIELDELERRFEDFYGVGRLERDEQGKPKLPTRDEMIEGLAYSLGKCCDPFVEIPRDLDDEEEQEEGDQVIVVLPAVLACNDDMRGRLSAGRGEHFIRTEKFARGGWAKDWTAEAGSMPKSGNPFVMSAYTMKGLMGKRTWTDGKGDPLSHVSSMQYYRAIDADNLPQWLMWAEDPDGESVFSELQDNIGLGFADPTFVRDERFRSLRWRPWAARADEAADQKRHEVTDAILWSFMGHQGADTSEEDARLIAAVKDVVEGQGLEELGWLFPLASFERRKFRFTRNPVRLEGGDSTSNLLVKRNKTVPPATITKFRAALDSPENHGAVVAILAEQQHFLEVVAREHGIGTVHLKALHRGVEHFLEDLEQNLPGTYGANKADCEAVLATLIERHKKKTLA